MSVEVPAESSLCLTNLIRFCLNYKALPYRTEWIEFESIGTDVYKKLGLPPSAHSPDGTPSYFLPVIHDTATGVSTSDSFAIAEYLEKTYPSPSLFPDNTSAFQSTVDDIVRDAGIKSLAQFILADIYLILNPESKPYFKRTREAAFGRALEDIAPKGEEGIEQWAAVKAGWDTVDAWYVKSGGPFVLGTTLSWADFAVASWLIWARSVWGEENQRWKDIVSWNDGRWEKVLNDLKEYQKVD